MDEENKELTLNLEEVNKSTGEVVSLVVNSAATVQPVALMRIGLFVPTLKNTNKSKINRRNVTDATEELIQLSIAKTEGYKDVQITGLRLDMDTDFKVWLGIIRSMSEHGVVGGRLKLSFVEFVKMCGFDTRRSNKIMRDRIGNALFKLASVTLKFQNETKGWTTHLVQSATYDVVEDTVEIEAEPKLFELYNMDHRVLLRLKAIDALQRKESAQALYTFIESLPADLYPLSMKRLRDRLNLTSNVYTQNHIVRKAMDQLKEIGYLDFTEVKRGKSVYFNVHYRNAKLLPPAKTGKRKSAEKPQDPAGEPQQDYDEIIRALELAGVNPQELSAALAKIKSEK